MGPPSPPPQPRFPRDTQRCLYYQHSACNTERWAPLLKGRLGALLSKAGEREELRTLRWPGTCQPWVLLFMEQPVGIESSWGSLETCHLPFSLSVLVLWTLL